MSITSHKNWFLYAAWVLAFLLILPYFSFLLRPIESNRVESIATSKDNEDISARSLDELLEQQSLK